MRELYLEYRDHELFDTMYTPEHYHFISNHMDAFKHMWTKQSKSFWCKHLTMYRHHCYNFGIVKLLNKDNMNPIDMPVECVAILADQIFIVLYNEFVNCRYGAAREFINDLTTLIANKNLVFACRNSSIRKNPFCMSETRDVFRKLLGCCRSYPQGMKDFYLLCLSYPIYGTFGGSIYHMLKRWLCTREVTKPVESYLQECWECPPELQSSTFVPQSFHRHVLEKSGDQVDKLLFHGCFGLFSSNRQAPTEGSILEIKKPGAGCKETKFNKLFETFVEYVSSREWFPNEKFVEEDLNMDFKDYLRGRIEDFEDEEFRRSMILKMAEKKFKEELEKESISSGNKEVSKNPQKCSCLSKQQQGVDSCKNEASIVLSENKAKGPIVCENKDCLKTPTIFSDKFTNTATSLTAIKASTSVSLKECHDASVNTINSDSQNNNNNNNNNNINNTKAKKSKKKNKKKQMKSEDTSPDGDSVSQANTKATAPLKVKSDASDKKEVKESNDKIKSGRDNCAPNPSGSGKTVDATSQTGAQGNNKSSSATSKSIPVMGSSSKNSLELEKIKKNIDTIKQSVQEQSSLSMDDFRLMVETGSLLMSGDSDAKSGNSKAGNQLTLQSCAQCNKAEEKSKTFKKCSRCKTENVKWVRYYCSRECQAIGWHDCHQEEHEKGLLAKK